MPCNNTNREFNFQGSVSTLRAVFSFPSDLGDHVRAGLERRGARNEVSLPSRTFSHMRTGHLRVS